MSVPNGRAWRRRGRKLAIIVGVALYGWIHAPQGTIADGDTRTLTFINKHTNETGTFTFRRLGGYDQAELEKLNWFMRDWRLNESTKMDPRLFDVIWDVYRQSGSNQPVDVLSGYRSPQTNAMLRRRSRQVAEHSQHMQGKAIDAHFLDVSTGTIRDVAMRMQEGGVGFYPIGSTPWVHIDSGTVRYWPRMSRNALTRLFPDGTTVFIPADGQPMSGYELARAAIEARGAEVQTASGGGGLFGWLFGGARGGGADDEEEGGGGGGFAGARGGPPVFAGAGRGAIAAPVAVAVSPPPPPAPALVTPPPDAVAPEREALAAVAPATRPDPESDVDAEPASPLPPRRPANLFTAREAPSPAPPRRPTDLELAASPARDGNDVIATLIERDALPSVITSGVRKPPSSALALTETKPSTTASPDALLRAATLSAPMPPPRPHDAASDGVSNVEKSPPLPPQRPAKTQRPSAANPFGSLVIDAFASPAPELRIPSP